MKRLTTQQFIAVAVLAVLFLTAVGVLGFRIQTFSIVDEAVASGSGTDVSKWTIPFPDPICAYSSNVGLLQDEMKRNNCYRQFGLLASTVYVQESDNIDRGGIFYMDAAGALEFVCGVSGHRNRPYPDYDQRDCPVAYPKWKSSQVSTAYPEYLKTDPAPKQCGDGQFYCKLGGGCVFDGWYQGTPSPSNYCHSGALCDVGEVYAFYQGRCVPDPNLGIVTGPAPATLQPYQTTPTPALSPTPSTMNGGLFDFVLKFFTGIGAWIRSLLEV